jgi:hypothetical protein
MAKFTREEMTNILAASTMFAIMLELSKEKYNLLLKLLKGDEPSFKQYSAYSDSELAESFARMFPHIKDNPSSHNILALAHVLNGEPIDLLKS